MDRDPVFIVRWFEHVHTQLIRGDVASCDALNVNPVLRGQRRGDDAECGYVVLVCIVLLLVDHIFNGLELNPVIAEHMSSIDKFNASFPSTSQIASAARQGGQLLGNSEWVKTLVQPIDRCVVDSLTSMYTGGVSTR